MANWKVSLCTASGDPAQCWDEFGEELFAVVYVRTTGGNDDEMPRRVLGTGPSRLSASMSAQRALATYDSAYSIVPSS